MIPTFSSFYENLTTLLYSGTFSAEKLKRANNIPLLEERHPNASHHSSTDVKKAS
jgi:hypothetical protein